MRGAGCNSYHRLLRAKILVGRKKYFRRPLAQTRKKWNISCLQDGVIDDQGELTAKGRYSMSVNEQLEAHRNEHNDIHEKWNVMKSECVRQLKQN